MKTNMILKNKLIQCLKCANKSKHWNIIYMTHNKHLTIISEHSLSQRVTKLRNHQDD